MSDALLWNEIGTIYQKMGALDESIQAYLKALELNPECAEYHYNLGRSYFDRKEYGRAVSFYRKSIPLFKTAHEQALVWNSIGDAYRALKDLDNAVNAYRKADALEMHPAGLSTPPQAQDLPGQIPLEGSGLASEKNAQPAAQAVSPAPSPPPEETQSSPASMQAGVSDQGNGKKELPGPRPNDPSLEEVLSKINVYEKVTRANPGNHRAWDTLGKLYKSIARYQDAINAYKHAIQIAPQNEHYYYYLGLLFAIEQENEDAVLAFESVLEINAEYILAHSALAGIYNRMGMVAKANQHIASALPLMNNESAYNRACFYAICGDMELATEFLRIALQNKDTSIEWVKTDPDLEPIRSDERYRQLIQEFEDPSRSASDGNFFSSELDGANNRLLPLLNNSLAR